jgi:5-methylcytosine-specific restriction enzyme A
MARTVKEWVGKTDDSMPPRACKLRIIARQDGKCAINGRPFTAKEKPEFDGKNRESNLQAIHAEPHKRKTATEAAVRAKVNANAAKRLGLRKSKWKPMPGSKASKWKKRMDGTVVRR